MKHTDTVGVREFCELLRGVPSKLPKHEPVHISSFTSFLPAFAAGRQLIRLLDVGCGEGRLVAALDELDAYRQRINYLGIDTDIRVTEPLKRKYQGRFADFDAHPAPLSVLLKTEQFDIVVCHNAIHEFAPGTVTTMLADMIELVDAHGVVILFDMAQLPTDDREACGVPWTSQEIRAVLEAGGLNGSAIAEISHPRSVPVYEFQIRPNGARLDRGTALAREVDILHEKLCGNVGASRWHLDRLKNPSLDRSGRDVLEFVESAARSIHIATGLPCIHRDPCNHRSNSAAKLDELQAASNEPERARGSVDEHAVLLGFCRSPCRRK